ncbi:hypothetical protein HDE_07596 [Halotydeus destructor]|nr:hypothetical protein HDE_07596 [Halotydeus destructor]
MADFQSPLYRKLRVLWFVSCVLGNTYQAYIIANSYLAHEAATQVKIQFPEKFEPPAISFCFALISMVKLDMALDRWPDLRTRLSQGFQDWTIQKNITLTESIAKSPFSDKLEISAFFVPGLKVKEVFDITHHASELLAACQYIQASSMAFVLKKCTDLYSITESIKSSVKCFTLKLKEKQNYNYLALQRMKQYPGGQSSIVMAPNVRNLSNDMTVYYHGQDSHGLDDFSHSVLLTPLDMFTMTYITIEKQLLPPPFDSACRNYSLSGFEDRGHCFSTCLNKQSLSKLGELAPGSHVSLGEFENERMTSYREVQNNATFRDMVYEINGYCDKQCSSPNCKESYHLPVLMSISQFKLPTLSTVEQLPQIETIDFPKLGLIECITDLLSSLGFWIGATCLSAFDLIWVIYFPRRTNQVDGGMELPFVQIMAIRRLQNDVRILLDRANDRAFIRSS